VQTNRNVFWVYVPSTCKTKKEKDNIIFDLIERVGQKIKIENNE